MGSQGYRFQNNERNQPLFLFRKRTPIAERRVDHRALAVGKRDQQRFVALGKVNAAIIVGCQRFDSFGLFGLVRFGFEAINGDFTPSVPNADPRWTWS